MSAHDVEKAPKERILTQQRTSVVLLIQPRLRVRLVAMRQRVHGNAVVGDAFGAHRGRGLSNEKTEQRRAGAEHVGRLDTLLGNHHFKHARPRRAANRACTHNQCLEQGGAIALLPLVEYLQHVNEEALQT